MRTESNWLFCVVFNSLLVVASAGRLSAQTNSEYRLVESQQEYWENETWWDAFKSFYSYDAEGRRLSVKRWIWEDETWQDFDTTRFVYADGKLTECQVDPIFRSRPFGESWLRSYTYTYDDMENVVEISSCGSEDTVVNTLSYDSHGYLRMYLERDGSYGPSICSYSYATNGRHLSVLGAGSSSPFGAFTKIQEEMWVYIVGKGTNLLQQQTRPEYSGWDSRQYVDYFSGRIVYYLSVGSHAYEARVTNPWDWNPHLRDIPRNYYYDPLIISTNPVYYARILQYSGKTWMCHVTEPYRLDAWNFFRRDYEYDDDGRLINDVHTYRDSTVFEDTTSTSDWQYYSQNTYFYDAAGNCCEILYELWDSENETWVNDTKMTFIYENTTTDVGDRDRTGRQAAAVPRRFSLCNYPNPFNAGTAIRFKLPGPAVVSVDIYDVTGKHIRTFTDEQEFSVGSHAFLWDGRDHNERPVPSGVYLYRLQVGRSHQVRRCVLIR